MCGLTGADIYNVLGGQGWTYLYFTIRGAGVLIDGLPSDKHHGKTEGLEWPKSTVEAPPPAGVEGGTNVVELP